MRYFIDICYKGTSFHGWQQQQNAHSVQEEIEKALKKILGSSLKITGSGRTDTGVHATQQIAHFDTEIDHIEAFCYKMNAVLHKDVAINDCYEVANEAHARFDADRRTYHYYVHTRKNPFKKEQSYFFKPDLDTQKINDACEILSQWTDFESFSKVHTDVKTFECQIYQCSWEPTEHGHFFEISANRFLRGMVRTVVGTLIDVGLGKLSLQEFALIERQKNRSAAGRAVPAHGLYLVEVHYPPAVYQKT